tara:strand:- start:3522 stop:5375 length:1854 start_codon:yes stop_codon:yes gene_type:complete
MLKYFLTYFQFFTIFKCVQSLQVPSRRTFASDVLKESDIKPMAWNLDDLYNGISKKEIENVIFSPDGRSVTVMDNAEIIHKINIFPIEIERLEQELLKKQIPFKISGGENDVGTFFNGLLNLTIIGILFAMLFSRFNLNNAGPGGNSFLNPKSKIIIEPQTETTFADVAGCEESKLELYEVVDFLKDPEKYTRLGAQSPRGVLLEGPPGTGKTLLARAIAGEANVPFIPSSGSEFVEVFVGVGASRIRNLFKEAKENGPCILFIDEIDAIGKKRSGNSKFGSGSNDEREQTLNQILTEMDGFEGNPGVIVLAATNRGDVLDDALLRPGRFDRRIPITLPTKSGRYDILKVHSKNKKIESIVDLEDIASKTIGFSGASLKNLMNEAAIITARRNGTITTHQDIDDAYDRITVGLKKPITSSLKQKQLVAYHEAGHALAAALLPGYDVISKITIIPRSNGAGGLTIFTPSDERVDSGLYTYQYLKSQLIVALGGRVAEEIVFGSENVTTGASSDLQKVRNLARRMVHQWGFRNDVNISNINDAPVAWESYEGSSPYKAENSIKTEVYLDNEIKKLVQSSYEECMKLLKSNRKLLDSIVQKLIEKETINGDELMLIMKES